MDKIASEIRIGIFGVGAIGSVMALLLNYKKNNQLSYFNRTQKERIKVITNDKTWSNVITTLGYSSNPEQQNWLIVCLKEYQFAEAKIWLQSLIHPNTKIAIVRNGLNLKDPFLAFSAQDNILECMIDCPVQQDENQAYRMFGQPKITIPTHPIADEFMALFDLSQAEIRKTTDFKTENWKKVCESACLGAILCLSGETCWVFRDPDVRKIYVDLLEESILVARADGAIIKSDFIVKMLDKLMGYPGDKGSSMLADRIKGRPIELGAKNGVIAQIAKRYDIPTPLNDFVVALLKSTNLNKPFNSII